jgi:hypothetical protein
VLAGATNMYEVVRHVDVHPPGIVRGVSPYMDEPYISNRISPHVSGDHIVGAAPVTVKGPVLLHRLNRDG